MDAALENGIEEIDSQELFLKLRNELGDEIFDEIFGLREFVKIEDFRYTKKPGIAPGLYVETRDRTRGGWDRYRIGKTEHLEGNISIRVLENEYSDGSGYCPIYIKTGEGIAFSDTLPVSEDFMKYLGV